MTKPLVGIRLEHADVVTALSKMSESKKRGAAGNPSYHPWRLGAAIATAGDAYALLLIATAEAFLREYLAAVGAISVAAEPTLGTVINRAAKELNSRTGRHVIRPADKIPIDDLRAKRNAYAHGHGRSVFPSVPKVEETLCKFLDPFP
jgi:hypothetical protein